MRIDNDGEGGIIALLALLGVKKQHRPAIVAAGLFGAALILQPLGTGKIGRVFGPIMLAWFAVMAALGVSNATS